MKNKIIPTIAVYLGERRELTIHKTQNEAYKLFDTEEVIHYIIFRHTSLEEVIALGYEQAVETEKTRKELSNGKQ
jgi:hypothetical protein